MDMLNSHLLVQEPCWVGRGRRLTDTAVASPSRFLPSFHWEDSLPSFSLLWVAKSPDRPLPHPRGESLLVCANYEALFLLAKCRRECASEVPYCRECNWKSARGLCSKIHPSLGHDSRFPWTAPSQWQRVAGILRQTYFWEIGDSSHRWLPCFAKSLAEHSLGCTAVPSSPSLPPALSLPLKVRPMLLSAGYPVPSSSFPFSVKHSAYYLSSMFNPNPTCAS